MSAPFDRLEWWQGLERHCALTPLLAVAREGKSVAILPLCRKGASLNGLANWYSFRIRPITTGPGKPLELLSAMARNLASMASHISLGPLPDEDGSATLLSAAFRQAGWIVLKRVCDTNHYLPLSGRSFAQYLASRPGPLRTTLRRKTAGVDTQILSHFDNAAWQAYEDIYRASWKPAEGSPAFLRSFAEQEGAAGRLRLGLASIGGHPVAAQLWTVEGGTAFIHKLAHRDDARAASPGTVLTAALSQHVIDRDRVTDIDFGTGDDPYKRDWMEACRPRYHIDCYRPWSVQNAFPLARAMLSRLAGRWKHG